MKITIITACYNAAATVGDAMASVARQRLVAGTARGACVELPRRNEERVELEYIVVDGGSTDGTVDVIKEFEHNHCSTSNLQPASSNLQPLTFTFKWLSERDHGLYDAINKGIRMATGDVIGICNADDALASDGVVAKIAATFLSQPQHQPQPQPQPLPQPLPHPQPQPSPSTSPSPLDCVYGKVYFVNELGGKMVRRCFAQLWRPWMLQWGYMPPHPGIFIRRECFERWGFYEPDRCAYRIAADYELLIRFFRVNKMRARYVKMYTTVMRTGGVSTKDVEARKKLNEEIIKANRVNGYFCCWPMLLPKYAIKIWEVILPRLGMRG